MSSGTTTRLAGSSKDIMTAWKLLNQINRERITIDQSEQNKIINSLSISKQQNRL